MSLQNLLAIRRLHVHLAEGHAVRRLLAAARRNLADSRVDAIGPDNRFDAAYKCVMQCAMRGLWANGYRTSTSQPGHHQTAIQSLTLTMGVEKGTVIVLDGMRKQRNINDYEGDTVSGAVLEACITEAEALIEHTEAWLSEKHSELLADP